MSNATARIGQHAKVVAVGSMFAVVTFVLAAFLVEYTPQQYDLAVLVGWIFSVFLAGQILKGRFLPGT